MNSDPQKRKDSLLSPHLEAARAGWGTTTRYLLIMLATRGLPISGLVALAAMVRSTLGS